jgi:membrane-associated phospholipid phosphatase
MSSYTIRSVATVAIGLFAAACEDSTPSDAVRPPLLAARATSPAEVTASAEWSAVARDLVKARQSNAFQAIRNLATLNLAQYNAAIAAEDESQGGRPLSRRAAVAAASVVALSYAYPLAQEALEEKLHQQLVTPHWLEEGSHDTDHALAIGRAVGEQVVAHAKTDRLFDPWTGTVPTGPGIWFSSAIPPAAPGGAGFSAARPFFLTSTSQFRPGPPPAFGSPEFLAALGEVRQISDTRTTEQDSIARFWGLPVGTITPGGYWNQEAAAVAANHGFNERRTARLLAVASMTAFDALIACNDGKYAYWLLRPTQADPGIKLAIGLPNFPSYPSNHACISSAAAEVIGGYVPGERTRLRALAVEAAISRVYGGIHYRFDGVAGLDLGALVAEQALHASAKVRGAFVLR